MFAGIAPRCARSAAVALLAVAAGCRTVNDVIVDYRTNISVGNYASAATEPAELGAKENGDRLMWRLMAASAYDLAGDTDAVKAGDSAYTRKSSSLEAVAALRRDRKQGKSACGAAEGAAGRQNAAKGGRMA